MYIQEAIKMFPPEKCTSVCVCVQYTHHTPTHTEIYHEKKRNFTALRQQAYGLSTTIICIYRKKSTCRSPFVKKTVMYANNRCNILARHKIIYHTALFTL